MFRSVQSTCPWLCHLKGHGKGRIGLSGLQVKTPHSWKRMRQFGSGSNQQPSRAITIESLLNPVEVEAAYRPAGKRRKRNAPAGEHYYYKEKDREVSQEIGERTTTPIRFRNLTAKRKLERPTRSPWLYQTFSIRQNAHRLRQQQAMGFLPNSEWMEIFTKHKVVFTRSRTEVVASFRRTWNTMLIFSVTTLGPLEISHSFITEAKTLADARDFILRTWGRKWRAYLDNHPGYTDGKIWLCLSQYRTRNSQ